MIRIMRRVLKSLLLGKTALWDEGRGGLNEGRVVFMGWRIYGRIFAQWLF